MTDDPAPTPQWTHPRPRGDAVLRLPGLRAAARGAGPRAARPGAGLHEPHRRADHQRLLDPRGVPARDPARDGRPRHRRPDLRRSGLPGARSPGQRARVDGDEPRRPVDRHLHGGARWPGDGLDHALRLRGAAGAVAACDGADGADRRLRPHRARHRLRDLAGAGHHRDPRRRRLGDQRREEVDRQRGVRGPGRDLGPRHRRRPGEGLRRREGHRGHDLHQAGGQDRPAGRPERRDPPARRPRAGDQPAPGGALVRRHRPGRCG